MGLNAQSKGQRLGIFKPTPKELKKVSEQERGEGFRVELLGRALPAVNTEAGARAVVNLMMDRTTGRPRGFGFVTMSTREEAQKAIDELVPVVEANGVGATMPLEAGKKLWLFRGR